MTDGVARCWNIAGLFEQAAAAFGEREALVIADQRRTFRQLDDEADRLAAYLRSIGVGQDDHVAVYAQNCVECVVAIVAAFNLRAAAVNVNFRYVEAEIASLLADARPAAVVVQSQFASRLSATELPDSLLPGGIVVVDDAGTPGSLPAGAVAYGELPAAAPPAVAGRSGDDRYILYTGGTTGPPKGVLWRHEDVLKAHRVHVDPVTGRPVGTPAELATGAGASAPRTVVALGQLMHGNGLWTMLKALLWGGRVVMQRRFDPAAAWRSVADEEAEVLSFVGDAMGRPLVEALEADGARAFPKLRVITSAAAAFTPAVQEGFFTMLPGVTVKETIGSSETGVDGSAEVVPGMTATRGGPTVRIGPDVALVGDGGELLELVPGTVGRIARSGHIALGYHGDPAKTAATFPVIGGRRWCVPGDYAKVVDPGTIVLLGRGSSTINTGGEKVYAEEVEGVLKAHPAIYDAVVVGVPHERWGSAVAAVLQLRPGAAPTDADLAEHCRHELAPYKVPRRLVRVDEVRRSPSGKPDHTWAREAALRGS